MPLYSQGKSFARSLTVYSDNRPKYFKAQTSNINADIYL